MAKKKTVGLDALISKFDGTTHHDPSKRDLKTDFNAMKGYLDPNHQSQIQDQLIFKFNELYKTTTTALSEAFGDDLNRTFDKKKDEEALKRIFNQYLEQFFKGYLPSVLEPLKTAKFSETEKFEHLAREYDRHVGIGSERDPGLAAIIDGMLKSEDYKLSDLKEKIRAMTQGGPKEGGHVYKMLQSLNFRAFNKYLAPHQESKKLHAHVLSEAAKGAKAYGLEELSNQKRLELLDNGPREFLQVIPGMYHGKDPEKLAIYDGLGFKKKPAKKTGAAT